MKSISANLNIMIKAAEKASKALIRDFGEIEKLQVSVKGPIRFCFKCRFKSRKNNYRRTKKSKTKLLYYQ